MAQLQLPLEGKTFIITRALDQQGTVGQVLTRLGGRVLELPVLSIVPPDDWSPLDDALQRIDTYDWLIFSSANGVRSVETRMVRLQKSLANNFKHLKIASVGKKTAKFLEEIGAKIDFIPPQFVADSLIDFFPEPKEGLKLLIPRVQSGGRTVLSESFESCGSIVSEVAAYESRCPSEIPLETKIALERLEVDLIAFTSAKTALHTSILMRQYFGENWLNKIKQAKIVSIGPQTSCSCRKYIGKVDKESNPHDLDGLMQSCMEIFHIKV